MAWIPKKNIIRIIERSVDSLNNIFGKQITVKNFQVEITNVEQDSWNILMLPVRNFATIGGGGTKSSDLRPFSTRRNFPRVAEFLFVFSN
jgi:hypothetical protein